MYPIDLNTASFVALQSQKAIRFFLTYKGGHGVGKGDETGGGGGGGEEALLLVSFT